MREEEKGRGKNLKREKVKFLRVVSFLPFCLVEMTFGEKKTSAKSFSFQMNFEKFSSLVFVLILSSYKLVKLVKRALDVDTTPHTDYLCIKHFIGLSSPLEAYYSGICTAA